MEKCFYQKDIETMPVEELKKLQSEKLVKQVKHVYENVPYYRNLMDEKGIKTAWTNAVNECSTKLSLKDADKDILMTLGKNIGKTDTDDQIKNIKYIKSMIAEQEKQAQSEYRHFGKMYRNGGVLVGLLIVIMLI